MAEAKSRISPILNLVDEALDTKLTAGYHLSMLVGLDSLSCAVLDIKRNKYLALCSWTFQGIYSWPVLCENISRIIKENKILNASFRSVSAAVVSNRSTLVPDALFEKQYASQYLHFNHPVEDDAAAMSDDLKNTDAQNVYALPRCLEQTLRSYYGNVRFLHHSTPLLESALLQHRHQDAPKVIVHVQMSHFEVVVAGGRKLIFYNSFSHQTSEDFIYYLLFVCEQLKLNPDSLELTLTGEIERNSAIYSILHKYVRNIRFGERSDSFEYSYKFSEVSKHFYYNLFNQYLCVS
jgi:hypothetical protein